MFNTASFDDTFSLCDMSSPLYKVKPLFKLIVNYILFQNFEYGLSIIYKLKEECHYDEHDEFYNEEFNDYMFFINICIEYMCFNDINKCNIVLKYKSILDTEIISYIYSILISNETYFDDPEINSLCDCLWLSNLPSLEFCYKLLNKVDNILLAHISIFYDDIELYKLCNITNYDMYLYLLAKTYNRTFIFDHQKDLYLREADFSHDVDKSKYYNFFIHRIKDSSKHLDDLNFYENDLQGYQSFYLYSLLCKKIELSRNDYKKEEIYYNVEAAYYFYTKNMYIDLCISKMLSHIPDYILELVPKNIYITLIPPYMAAYMVDECYYKLISLNENYIYTIILSFMLQENNAVLIKRKLYNDIKIPEYTLLVLSSKLNVKIVYDNILKLAEKEGCFYKILDLENKTYLDPPLKISLDNKVDFEPDPKVYFEFM